MEKKKIFKSLFLISVLGFVFSSCGNQKEYGTNDPINISEKEGELSAFNLLTPTVGSLLEALPTFTWEASTNAVSYTLEVCSREDFIHTSSEIVYTKETNISCNHFTLSSSLKKKDITYYWKVTAINNFNDTEEAKKKVCNAVFSFEYKAIVASKVDLPIGEVSDWTLHKEGSYANISVDKNNFFKGDEKESLVISFDKEHTKRGVESSDGWMVITKAIEKDLYGCDSVYFNFYYSGNDSNIFLRFVDEDGEYWHKQISISLNSKQTVLLKFSDFILRRQDTLVQNEIFDYQHIQSVELVFEKTFGDGVCIISNMKATHYEDYKDMYVQDIKFDDYGLDQITTESYKFGRTISSDGKEMKLEYSTDVKYGNDKGIGSYGYGFAKFTINKFLGSGNAFRMKISFSGYQDSNSKLLFRVYEEDMDRWVYEQPFSSMTKDGFEEITIPFSAFLKSEVKGDGLKQFAYVLNLQFGASGLYGNGSVTFKDVSIVTIPPVSQNKKVIVNKTIENFDDYSFRTQIYEHWETSVDNKDESISLSSLEKFNDGSNVNCGQFTYKSDMMMATYDTYLDVSYEGADGISFWAKDASKKSDDSSFSYLNSEDVAADMTIQIVLKDNRWYRYEIKKLPKLWTRYEIPFSEFELDSGYIAEDSISVTSENVINLAFGLQYFYYKKDGTPKPVYMESNPVYMDTFEFVDNAILKTEGLSKIIEPDPQNPNLVILDRFEYENETQLKAIWSGINGLDFESVSLDNDVSSEGGNHSMKLAFKGQQSPSYATFPTFATSAKGKGFAVDLKTSKSATIYINFYLKNGSSLIQYRYTIFNSPNVWTRYEIGFAKLTCISSTSQTMGKDDLPKIQRITFGAVENGNEDSSLNIDNFIFDLSYSYDREVVTVL